MLTPLTLLLGSLGLLGIVVALVSMRRTLRESRLRALSMRHGFHFSPHDVLRLASRIDWPAGPRPTVRDVMYRSSRGRRTFVFTASQCLIRGRPPLVWLVVAVERSHADSAGEVCVESTEPLSDNAYETRLIAAASKSADATH